MKLSTVLFLSALTVAIIGAACTNAPVATTPRQQVIANAVEDFVTVGLVPVLTKNPRYVAAVTTIAKAMQSFSGATLTPADVAALMAHVTLAPDDAQAIAGIVNAAWGIYQKRYAEQVGASIRPDVALFLKAASNGILAAVAAVPPVT